MSSFANDLFETVNTVVKTGTVYRPTNDAEITTDNVGPCVTALSGVLA